MAEKVTTMVLKVDLQCLHCRKKIKKILRKFPQIRDQVYDEKQNTVVIKVVCCSPEKIRDKLCCKGGKTIKSIDIVPPAKPKAPPPPDPPKKTEPPPKAPEPAPPPPPPKTPERPPEAPAPPPNKPKTPPIVPEHPPQAPAPPPPPPTKPPQAPERPPQAPAPERPPTEPVKLPEPACAYPIGICCGPCYEGRVGGPCYHGYGVPPPPPPGPCYDSYGGYGRGYCVSRGDCFSDENPLACTIM